MKRQMLSIPDVMRRMNLSYSTVYQLIRGGKLRAAKVGVWRIDEDDLEAFIASKQSQVVAPAPVTAVLDADAALGLDSNRFL